MANNNDYGILESIDKGVACGLLSFYAGDEIAAYRWKGITREQQQCVRHAARKRGRYHYDFFIPIRVVKRIGIIGTIKLLIWLRTKKESPPIPHVQDNYVVCSELGQESYQDCTLQLISNQYILIPDAVPLNDKLELLWRGQWSLEGTVIEFQPGDLVLVHSRGFNVLRFLFGMYWNHLLIIDEKV